MDTGIYRDYQGKHVQVFGIAQHEQSGERLVVYVAIEPGRGPRFRCGSEEWFTENVEVGTNLFTPRFEYIGDQLPQ